MLEAKFGDNPICEVKFLLSWLRTSENVIYRQSLILRNFLEKLLQTYSLWGICYGSNPMH